MIEPTANQIARASELRKTIKRLRKRANLADLILANSMEDEIDNLTSRRLASLVVALLIGDNTMRNRACGYIANRAYHHRFFPGGSCLGVTIPLTKSSHRLFEQKSANIA